MKNCKRCDDARDLGENRRGEVTLSSHFQVELAVTLVRDGKVAIGKGK